MARTLGTLTVDLLARTGAFITDMGRAARATEQTSQRIRRAATQIGAALGAGIATQATAAAAAIGDAIRAADQIGEAAERTGFTTEALSRLGYAAQLSGSSLETLERGVVRLARQQVEAARGNETAARTFENFGISITDAEGGLRSTEAVLLDLADVFQQLPAGVEKTALATELFGRSGTELVGTLSRGREGITALGDELESLGGVIRGDAAAAAGDFNDTLDRARLALRGVALQVTQEILPTLTEFAGKLNDPQFRDGFAAILSGAVNATAAVVGLTAELGNLVNFAAEEVAFQVTGDAASGDIVRLQEQAASLRRQIAGDIPATSATPFAGIFQGGALAPRGDRRAELERELAGVEESIRAAEAALQAQSSAQAEANAATDEGTRATTDANAALEAYREALERDRTARERAAGASAAAAEAARAQAEEERRRQEIIAAGVTAQESLNAVLRQQADAMGEGSPLFEASRAYADRLTELIGLEDALREAQLLTAGAQAQLAAARAEAESQLAEAADQAARETDRLLKDKRKGPLQESVDEVSEYALEAARGIQGIISGALTDGFEGGVDGILASFEKLITEITAQIVAAQIAESLFGGLTGSGGKGPKGGGFDFGGLISSFLGGFGGGYAKGGVFAGGQVQAFANGGVVGSPTLFPMGGGRTGLMGEAGPEAIMPLTRGPDGKLGVRAEGGSRSTTINVTVPGNTARETAMQLAAEASRAVRRTARN